MFTHPFALDNPASVGQQVLAVVSLISVDSLLCPADIFSVPPSANCVLPWSAVSSWLFSSTLCCQFNSLCLLWDLPFLLHFWPRGRSHSQALCLGFVPKQRDSLTSVHTNGNECYLLCYIYIYIYIIHRQTVSFYHNSSMWLDTRDASSWIRNPPMFTSDW